MTQEEKQLLLQDLCAMLVYGVMLNIDYYDLQGDGKLKNRDVILSYGNIGYCSDNTNWVSVKPYLRPMSNMTEEEKREFQSFFPGCFGDQWLDIEEGTIEIFECSSTMTLYLYDFERMIDWLNAHHFDYRGLIEKGLAIEAPINMYKI